MRELSIHPRNWPKTGNGQKHNTSKPPKDMAKGKLGKVMARLEGRRRAFASGKQVHMGRIPGSMKVNT